MAQVKHGDTVKIHFIGTLEDGTVFGSTFDTEPLQFTIGGGQVIPGLEEAVIGMSPGEIKKPTIPSDKGFGPRDEEMVIIVDRQEFPEDMNIEVGKELQVNREGSQIAVYTITDVSEMSVTLDENHPLAGKDLLFDIKLIEIM